MTEADLSTRVETQAERAWRRPLVGPMAHGPEKGWERIGQTTTVACTVRVETLRAARSRGVNLSGALQGTLDRILGGSDLARIDEELRSLIERQHILEAARERLLERRKAEEDAASRERAREEAIQGLAEEFSRATVRTGNVDVHRPSLGRAAINVRWLEERVSRHPLLKSLKAAEVLDLLLAAASPRGNGPAPGGGGAE